MVAKMKQNRFTTIISFIMVLILLVSSVSATYITGNVARATDSDLDSDVKAGAQKFMEHISSFFRNLFGIHSKITGKVIGDICSISSECGAYEVCLDNVCSNDDSIVDTDNDGFNDYIDNCASIVNVNQSNLDFNSNIPSSGLISHYKFDEGIGFSTYDSISGGIGTISNPLWVEGLVDSALNYTGYDSPRTYVSVDDLDSINLGQGDFTLAAWVNGPGMILSKGSGNGGVVTEYIWATSGFWFKSASWSDWRYAQGSTLAFDSWGHVTLTYDESSNMLSFYENGVLLNSLIAQVGTYTHHTTPMYIGVQGNELLNPKTQPIDELVFYNRVLSLSEIQELNSVSGDRTGDACDCNDIICDGREDAFCDAKGTPDLVCNPIVVECGNNIIESGEECDDGNVISGDGCNSLCQTEGMLFPSLIGYWNFDDAQDLGKDMSGNSNTMSVVGPVYDSIGHIDGSAYFDGVNDYTSMPHDTSFDLTDMTISAWVYIDTTTNTGYRRVVSKDNYLESGTRKLYSLLSSGATNNLPSFLVLDGSDIDQVDSDAILTNGWHHLVGVRDAGNNVRIYVNGVLKNTAVNSFSGAIDSLTVLNIGAIKESAYSDQFFNGKIDEVAIFNEAFSDGEVLDLYNGGILVDDSVCGNSIIESGEECDDGNVVSDDGCDSSCQTEASTGGFVPGLIGYWNFDDSDNLGKEYFSDTYNAAVYGPVYSIDGKTNGAAVFDGINDYMSVVDNTDFNLINMTISTWVYVDSSTNTGYNRLVSKDNYLESGTRKVFTLRASDNTGRPQFLVLDNTLVNYATSPSILTTGWHHLVGVRDAGKTLKLYVDGSLKSTATNSFSSSIDSSSVLNLGAIKTSGYSGEYFNGKIDDVAIFNKVLSDTEVVDLFNNGITIESVCGNNILESGEACDDGNTISGDGCSDVCLIESLSVCGNNILESGEACDDGNVVNNDGCSSVCTIEHTLSLDGLASYWSFDNPSDLGKDDSGSGYDATNYGATYDASGVFKGAASFNGVGSYMETSTAVPTSILEWSIEARFNWKGPSGNNPDSIVYNGNGGLNGYGINLFDGSGYKIGCLLGGVSYGESSIVPSQDTWYHAVCTRGSDGYVRLYLDGIEIHSFALTPNPIDGSITIGSYGNDPYGMFNGLVDEFRVWNKTLSAEEVNNLMNNNVNVDESICGNNVLESGEECDDGNIVPGDGCSVSCLIEASICLDIDNDGYDSCDNDCDDLNQKVYPNALELCDGLDNDCDGVVDEDCFTPKDYDNDTINDLEDNCVYIYNVNQSNDLGGLLSDLINDLPFEERYGTITYDFADGSYRDSTKPMWVNGIDGSALDFDGRNDFVPLTTNGTITDSFTVSAWIYPRTSGYYKTFASYHNNEEDKFFFLSITDRNLQSGQKYPTGGIDLSVNDNGMVSGYQRVSYPIELNEWHHVVATGESNENIRLWLDGVLVGEKSIGPLDSRGLGMFNTVGSYGLGRYYDGIMDQYLMWNRVVEDTEIERLYNGGLGRSIIINEVGSACDCFDGICSDLEKNWCIEQGTPDENCIDPFNCVDNDNDGFSPEGGVCGIVDCDDSDSSINPIADEVCNDIDDNCNGLTDEGFDFDGDLFSVCSGDCDDTNARINPQIKEVCNGFDDNCNGIIDENCASDVDNDNDDVVNEYDNCVSISNLDQADRDIYNYTTEDLNIHLSDSLKFYYPFDEGVGNLAHDKINRISESIEKPEWTNGKIGPALYFDGTNDYINLGEDYSGVSDSITVSMWANVNKFGYYKNLFMYHSVADDFFIMVSAITYDLYNGVKYPNGAISVTVNDNGQVSGYKRVVYPIESGEWHHILATVKDYESLKLYVDGNLVDEVAVGKLRSRPLGNQKSIGAFLKDGRFFSGKLDEVMVWNKKVSDHEIDFIYNNGTGRSFVGNNIGDACDCFDNVCQGTESWICQQEGTEDFVCAGGCTDLDKDGFSSVGGICGEIDCDDTNSEVYPDAEELCDNIDNNCDGIVDEYFDQDNDGYRTCDNDCNDNSNTTYPGAFEVCDEIDNNCDGVVDENQGDCTGENSYCLSGQCVPENCDDGMWCTHDMWYDNTCHNVESFNVIEGGCIVDSYCDENNDEWVYEYDSSCCSYGDTIECGSDKGACSKGVQQCGPSGSFMAECIGEVSPAAEACDGLDNDCDGFVDENCGCEDLTVYPSVYTSCYDILEHNPDSESGNYAIDPDGDGPVLGFMVYCDMVTKGGGWTLVAHKNKGKETGTTSCLVDLNTTDSGVIDQRWNALLDVSTNIISKDPANNILEVLNITPMLDASCVSLATSLSDHNLAHDENSGCGATGMDYCTFGGARGQLSYNTHHTNLCNNKFYIDGDLNSLTYWWPDELNIYLGKYTKESVTQCGNSIVEGGEECDDGNLINDDDCSNACVSNVLGPLLPPEYCAHGDTRTCGSNLGECSVGYQTCDMGKWSDTCYDEISSDTEMCNGLDNDCNGVVDDDCSCIDLAVYPSEYTSCYDILEKNSSAKSGIYAIDPDMDGPVLGFQVYCDMDTRNGGWTLVAHKNKAQDTKLTSCLIDLNSKDYAILDERWNALLEISGNFISKNPISNVSVVLDKTPMVNSSCLPLVDSLSEYNLAHDENSGCGAAGMDYCTFGGTRNSLSYNTHHTNLCSDKTYVEGDVGGPHWWPAELNIYVGNFETGKSECGNGVYELGEECDDGNSYNNDFCTNLCKNHIPYKKDVPDDPIQGEDDCLTGTMRDCGSDIGECNKGVEYCEFGQWSGICIGENPSSFEVCDGSLDEDCDGFVDESCNCIDGESRTCGSNIGECITGTESCIGGIWTGICAGEVIPSAEVCDSLDNDCNGMSDDYNFGNTTCGLGVCEHTINNCELGVIQICDPLLGQQFEVCDGFLDENCDGFVDDGCECIDGTSRSCGSDIGECSSGTEICASGLWSGICDGEVVLSAEVCDGLDNDCSGTIDDYDFGTTTCGLGACENTINNCLYGSLQTCNPFEGQQFEVCDGVIDEDCDGSVDEDCGCINGETRICGSNVGECLFGIEACIGGAWSGACEGSVEPSLEVCDGLDNDCSGISDDLDFGTTTCGLGICEHTINNCESGIIQSCNPLEGQQFEVCDGILDESCDGFVDEGCNCVDGTTRNCGSDIGECVSGIETCSAGTWDGVCTGEVLPNNEICDGLDNDCSGSVDDYDFGTTSCGLGICDHTINNCMDGDLQICNPFEGQQFEVCDGTLDEDCDGSVDEECECISGQTRTCGNDIGECVSGTEICTSGSWSGICDGEIVSSFEICDGLDNDCSGLVDDYDFGTTSCGLGICEHIVNNCEAGIIQSCNPFEGQQFEICDGILDENCDGSIDEGCNCIAGETRICGSDIGECISGVQTCKSGMWSLTCQGEVLGSIESCDGLDNDCNGLSDDGDFGTTTCGLGACENTINNCVEGELKTCDAFYGISIETCDGLIDQDCDGLIDEGCDCIDGETKSCGSDIGECVSGTETCSAGTWSGICIDEITPSLEICDGLDNDCSGLVDDFNFGTTTCGLGICDHIINNCEAGIVQTCNPLEGQQFEVCDGVFDENCDGSVDENCNCINGEIKTCGSDIGECVSGTKTCTSGSWTGICSGEISPVAEICDGLDNDCSGLSDDFDFGTTSCGLGSCSHTVDNCIGGVVNTCNPFEGSIFEVCDGILDEDCDGAVDEGCACINGATKSCGSDIGECISGTETCTDGSWSGVCLGEVSASTEVCDGLDNDCSGVSDDFDFGTTTCGFGECIHTTNNCEAGIVQTCNPFEGAIFEICDGSLDENCDGFVDDGCECVNSETRSCGSDIGECVSGTQACVLGIWENSCVGEVIPSAEVCDGLDNDCSGLIDDYDFVSATCGIGECLHTINTCEAGVVQTCNPFEGAIFETCDGTLDEDCDGFVDEGCDCINGDTRSCGSDIGECVSGTETCTSGSWSGTCVGETTPSAEICDGLDNDCSGLSDDYNFGTTVCGLGECTHTINNCESGITQICNPLEGQQFEVCDGILDEDCDGTIDNSCECTNGNIRSCGSDIGECVSGTETCTSGSWSGACVGEVIPSAEVCDNLDNDCSGVSDDFDFGTTACGLGECLHTINNCELGVLQSCNPLEGVSLEICDGILDENCNGFVDDGCECINGEIRTCGSDIGECVSGTESCNSGSWSGICSDEIIGSIEVCDGLDNDCNGLSDDGDFGTTTCGVGSCLHTVNNCESGIFQSCNPFEGVLIEACADGIDNDCDGLLDEDCPDCGNAEMNYPEECDDGNLVNGDGCTSTCQSESILNEVSCWNDMILTDLGNGQYNYVFTKDGESKMEFTVGYLVDLSDLGCSYIEKGSINNAQNAMAITGLTLVGSTKSVYGGNKNKICVVDDSYTVIESVQNPKDDCLGNDNKIIWSAKTGNKCGVNTPGIDQSGNYVSQTCTEITNKIIRIDGLSHSFVVGIDDIDEDGYDVYEDCDDNNPEINPGADEICDGIDNNCDGRVDFAVAFGDLDNSCGTDSCQGSEIFFNHYCIEGQGCAVEQEVQDNDGDGFNGLCNDCNDNDINTYPGAQEICPDDLVDNNCDGMVTFDCGAWCDVDSDGYYDASTWYCFGNDCNDVNAMINPGATEECNQIDNDCNGIIDDRDNDLDGYNDCDGTDRCFDTTMGDNGVVPLDTLKPNSYGDDSIFMGCNCEQILDCKPGSDSGEFKHGCSQGTINVWTSQIGWSQECQSIGPYGYLVMTAGESQDTLDNDGDGIYDIVDTDDDNDGIIDLEDSERTSKLNNGKPDWWCEKNPAKC